MSKLGVIFLTWRRSLQKDLVPHKITLKQQYVLNQLSRNEFLYPSQIAEMLFCDRPTATVIMKNLERNTWITRQQDDGNRKQVKIRITETGSLKLAELKTAAASSDSDGCGPLACLTEDERKQLDFLLNKVLKDLKTKAADKP
jgi:DNA-binding MarR family transcriptional regulator